MSRSVEGDWVLDEAEVLLDMDGRRERLELVVAGLQSGKVQPVGHATARPDREAHPRPSHPVTWAASLAGSCRNRERWMRSMT
jgi:hypothetical protein